MKLTARDKIVERAAPFLQQGEQPQAAFAAMTVSPLKVALIGFILASRKRPYRAILATDRRILVLEATMGMRKITGLLRELPRATRIGPAKGLHYKTDVLGERMWIPKVEQRQVAEADAAIGA